jgi:hypothetical protein
VNEQVELMLAWQQVLRQERAQIPRRAGNEDFHSLKYNAIGPEDLGKSSKHQGLTLFLAHHSPIERDA